MRDPEEVLAPVVPFLDLCKIPTAKVTIKRNAHVTTFLEFLSDPLRMNLLKVHLLGLSQWETLRHVN